MEDLYIHIHCARENGVSPVMAQLSAANVEMTDNMENTDGDGGAIPTGSETTMEVHEFDINSLQFTNQNKKDVYVSTIFIVYKSPIF